MSASINVLGALLFVWALSTLSCAHAGHPIELTDDINHCLEQVVGQTAMRGLPKPEVVIWPSRIPVFVRGRQPNPHSFVQQAFFFWDPWSQGCQGVGKTPKCPHCNGDTSPNGWTNTVKKRDTPMPKGKGFPPRKIFDTHRTVLLIARRYRCTACKPSASVSSYDPDVLMAQLPFEFAQKFPFIMTKKAGFTKALAALMQCVRHGLSKDGLSFEQIEFFFQHAYTTTHKEQELLFLHQYQQYLKCACEKVSKAAKDDGHGAQAGNAMVFPGINDVDIGDAAAGAAAGRPNCNAYVNELKFPQLGRSGFAPSRDYVHKCILRWFWEEDELRCRRRMAKLGATTLHADHTFSMATKIGCTPIGSRKWSKQFECAYLVLNQDGLIVTWRFCKSTKGEYVDPTLDELKQRPGVKPKVFYTDKCCGRGGDSVHIKKHWPDCLVKVDLFHIIRRVTNVLSRDHPYCTSKTARKEFAHAFRAEGDYRKKRRRATPEKKIQQQQLETWKTKYSTMHAPHGHGSLITRAVCAAFDKVMFHVTRGCVEKMPADCGGTSRNEGIHRLANRRVNSSYSRVSAPTTAQYLFSELFDDYNNIQEQRVEGRRKNNGKTPPNRSYHRRVPIDDECSELREHLKCVGTKLQANISSVTGRVQGAGHGPGARGAALAAGSDSDANDHIISSIAEMQRHASDGVRRTDEMSLPYFGIGPPTSTQPRELEREVDDHHGHGDSDSSNSDSNNSDRDDHDSDSDDIDPQDRLLTATLDESVAAIVRRVQRRQDIGNQLIKAARTGYKIDIRWDVSMMSDLRTQTLLRSCRTRSSESEPEGSRQRPGGPGRQPEPASAHETLNHIADTFQLTVQPVAPDGFCFFNSIAVWLQRWNFHGMGSWPFDRIVETVRRLVIREMQLNAQDYAVFMPGEDIIQQAGNLLNNDGWRLNIADAVPLAAATALQVNIMVLTTAPGLQYLHTTPLERPNNDSELEFGQNYDVGIAYVAYNQQAGHYDAAVPRTVDRDCDVNVAGIAAAAADSESESNVNVNAEAAAAAPMHTMSQKRSQAATDAVERRRKRLKLTSRDPKRGHDCGSSGGAAIVNNNDAAQAAARLRRPQPVFGYVRSDAFMQTRGEKVRSRGWTDIEHTVFVESYQESMQLLEMFANTEGFEEMIDSEDLSLMTLIESLYDLVRESNDEFAKFLRVKSHRQFLAKIQHYDTTGSETHDSDSDHVHDDSHGDIDSDDSDCDRGVRVDVNAGAGAGAGGSALAVPHPSPNLSVQLISMPGPRPPSVGHMSQPSQPSYHPSYRY